MIRTMRLVSFLGSNGTPTWGRVEGDSVLDLGPTFADRLQNVRAVLSAGALGEVATAGGAASALGSVTLLPPVTDSTRILCAGVNYDAHRIETGRDATASPTIFTRYPSSLVGHGVPLVKPTESDSFDFEGELAVIIGRSARRVSAEDALRYVAGYSCFQDGSVRDWQRKTTQFTPGKNFEASGAMGPWLITADEVPDPQVLHLQTILDGEVMQDAPTEQMIFSVAELIAFCSVFTTLEPGDVIATGTPGGVGAARKPPVWMKVGSTVEVAISGVGSLVNGVIEG